VVAEEGDVAGCSGLLEGTRPRALTPTTDTNSLGHCRNEVDAWSVLSQASDSIGHLGRACKYVVTGRNTAFVMSHVERRSRLLISGRSSRAAEL
jgi:hypothetical protein